MIYLPQYDKLDVRLLEKVLSDQNITLSYKLFWFKSILHFVVLGKKQLSFAELVNEMIATAWYMVAEYKLNLGYRDTLQKIVEYTSRKYNIPSNEPRKNLIDFLERTNDAELIAMRKILYNYVPYRLLTPFYEEQLHQIPKNKAASKHQTIRALSFADERSLYRFMDPNESVKNVLQQETGKTVHDKETITVNQIWFNYLRENQIIVSGWLNYKLINYLQKKNPNVPAIPFKLEPPQARKLTAATHYWSEVGKIIPLKDIYVDEYITGETMARYGAMSIDHFIPWSFVMHDELWNLIPCFKNVNSMKSNRLPDLGDSFDRYCDLQFEGVKVAGSNKNFRKLLEDYLSVFHSEIVLRDENMSKEKFKTYMKDTIYPLHQIAYNQGFSVWDNRNGLM